MIDSLVGVVPAAIPQYLSYELSVESCRGPRTDYQWAPVDCLAARRAALGPALRVHPFLKVIIDDIIAALGISQTAACSDMGTLVDLGVVTRDEAQKTHTDSAVPITLTANLDGDEYTATPILIKAVGRSPHDQDPDPLLERYVLG